MEGTITIALMAVCAAILIGWDIYVAFGNDTPNREDTISGILLEWSRVAWILPYAFGVLAGHLFLPVSPLSLAGCPAGLCVGILLASGLAVSGFNIWARRRGSVYPWPVQAPLLLLAGVVAGHVLWFQTL